MSRSTVYPRPDAPLVPSVLVPILGSRRVDAGIARRYGLPPDTRLADLDVRVWSEFPSDSIEPLAEQVIAAAREARDEIGRTDALARIDPTGAGLSQRARNALFRAGLFKTPWLNEVPLKELAEEPGVGAKTLLEWLVAGEALGPPPAPAHASGDPERSGLKPSPAPAHVPAATDAGALKASRAVGKAASRLRRRRWARSVTLNDPRLGHLVSRIDSRAQTALDAAELASKTPVNAAMARKLVRSIRELEAAAGRVRGLTLDEEIDQVLIALLDSSEAGRQGVKLRLGLLGAPPLTLAEAGRQVGLTRERVRQLERRLADGVEAQQPWMPVLTTALNAARTALPATEGEIATLLRERGLVRSTFSTESLLSAARAFGLETDFHHDAEAAVLFRGFDGVSRRQVAVQARRLTTHWGASTVETLSAELESKGNASVELVRLLLEAVPGHEWLDDEKEWFWIKGTTRNRLLNQIEKIMSIAGSIHVTELREGAGRHHRMEGFRPPREVLARLCVQSGLYRRDGDTVLEGRGLRSWEEVLGDTVERRLAEALFEFGPVMRRDDLERVVVDERGVNRSSFYVYLGYSPIIARYAPGVYGLRGARVSAGEVNSLIPPRVRTQRLIDSGWTSDGKVWIASRLSAASGQSGVLTVPAALQSIIAGSYLLFSEQEHPIGTLVAKENRMWGVRPFFTRWGVEEGDFVVVTLDITAGRATIAAGGEELLLRYQDAE